MRISIHVDSNSKVGVVMSFFMGLVFLILGLITVSVSVINACSSLVPTNYLEEKGRAVSYNKIEFVVDGETYTITKSSGSYVGGEVVDIMYNPDNPQEARVVDNSSSKWVAVVIGSIAGLAFAGAGVFVIRQGVVSLKSPKYDFEDM